MTDEPKENEATFQTSRGYTVRFRNIAYLLNKLPYPKIAVPTYTIKTATGVTETHEHDETTLKTDEDKATWAEYVAKRNAAYRQYDQDFTRLVLMKGVAVEMPEGDGWVKEQEFVGIQVPTDPLERRWHWLQTELVGGAADVDAIILAVLAESQVSEEVLSAMADSFRHPLGSDAAARPAVSAGQPGVDVQPKIRRGTSRRKKRHDRERV